MVKIKDGYVMSPHERAEFERQDALPRKTSGQVAYYFKPQTKYPPRIYAFIHAELWCERNRRPMGLHTAFPFLTRPMSKAEIEYHHFDWRLCYHQYEDWDKLLGAAAQEAEELDSDHEGQGGDFFNALKSFCSKFPLKGAAGELPPVPPGQPADEETLYLRELIATGDSLDAASISALLDSERTAAKRPAVLTALCQLYRDVVKPPDERQPLDEQDIMHKVEVQKRCARRNFVRRVYGKNRLFALEEIQQKYPAYTEEMLIADLQRKPAKARHKKHKPVTDLRRCQLQKLALRLRNQPLNEKEYQATCNQIVLLQNAHDHRLPVPLTVKLQGETLVYFFNWKIREGVVKAFVELANRKDMTHSVLQGHYEQMRQSNFSY